MLFLRLALLRLNEAATSPLALVAYAIAVFSAAYLSWSLANFRFKRKLLLAIPESKRDERLREISGPVPDDITADQWIRERRNGLLFWAFLAVCVTVCIITIAVLVTPTPYSSSDIDKLRYVGLGVQESVIQSQFGAPTFADFPSENGRGFFTSFYMLPDYWLNVGYDTQHAVVGYAILAMTDKLSKVRLNRGCWNCSEDLIGFSFRSTVKDQCVVGCEPFAFGVYDQVFYADSSSKFWVYCEGLGWGRDELPNTGVAAFSNGYGFNFPTTKTSQGPDLESNFSAIDYYLDSYGKEISKKNNKIRSIPPYVPINIPEDNSEYHRWRINHYPNGIVRFLPGDFNPDLLFTQRQIELLPGTKSFYEYNKDALD